MHGDAGRGDLCAAGHWWCPDLTRSARLQAGICRPEGRRCTQDRTLPSDSDSCSRVWQRRLYPYGVYSDRKRLEKLNHMHNNPVKRALALSAEQWPWSSYRFYCLNDSPLLSMDRLV